MDRIIWTDKELALFGGALEEDFSFDDGIREAEAFYGSPRPSQQPDRLRAEQNRNEIATSMNNSEQAAIDDAATDLSHTQALNHTPAAAQHPLAIKDRLVSPTINSHQQEGILGVVNGKELPDIARAGQDISTLVFRSPARDTTTVYPSIMSAVDPERNIESTAGKLDPPDTPTESTSSNSSVLLLSPVPRAFASTPKPSEDDPPSSIGKNSLIEEMRGEDDAAAKDEGEGGEGNEDNMPKLDLTGFCEIKTFSEDDPSGAPDKISGGPVQDAAALNVDADLRLQQLDGTYQETSQLSELTSANGSKATKSLVQEDVDMMNDEGSMLDSAKPGSKIPQKRKRPARSTRRDQGAVSKADAMAANSEATREVSQAPLAGPNRSASDTTTTKAAKGALIPRELMRLTGSDLLSSSALPQKRGEGRQTRAQKAAEADSVPNAGGAAKTRHRKSGA